MRQNVNDGTKKKKETRKRKIKIKGYMKSVKWKRINERKKNLQESSHKWKWFDAYLTAVCRNADRLKRMFGCNAVAFATIASSVFVGRVFRIANCALRFACIGHENFLHFAIIQIVQLTNGRLCACNQFDQHIRRTRPFHQLMRQQFIRRGPIHWILV